MRIARIVILYFILAGNACRAQSLFEIANQQFDSQRYTIAAGNFNQFVSSQTSTDTIAYCYKHLAECYVQLHYYDSAQIMCNLLLHNNFKEIGAIGTSNINPSGNYKHYASTLLSDLYEYQHHYDSALYYLTLSDTKYPFISYCGNEIYSDNYGKDRKYSRLYEKTGHHKRAEKQLLQIAFFTHASDTGFLNDLKKLLLQDHHINGYKRALGTSVNKIKMRSKKIPHSRHRYSYYYVKFSKVKMYLPYKVKEDSLNSIPEILLTKKEIAEKLKQSAFYQMVQSL